MRAGVDRYVYTLVNEFTGGYGLRCSVSERKKRAAGKTKNKKRKSNFKEQTEGCWPQAAAAAADEPRNCWITTNRPRGVGGGECGGTLVRRGAPTEREGRKRSTGCSGSSNQNIIIIAVAFAVSVSVSRGG